MATIKKSNTSKIFEKNNFGKYLSVLSNENIIEKMQNSKNVQDNKNQINTFLNKKRVLGGSDFQIDSKAIAELLQSVITYGKFTNEIINDTRLYDGLEESFKIIYLSHDSYKKSKDNFPPNFLSKISVADMLNLSTDSSDSRINRINERDKMPYLRDRSNPGLSAFQILNPEFRICFKNSQEIDLFFNMLSTLDMSMSRPYVNAEFIIPNKATRNVSINNDIRTNETSYLTASLNNFLLGDSYFKKNDKNKSLYDDITDAAKAINGDFFIDEYSYTKNAINREGSNSQIKKTYHRQSLNNAVFFSPQTMVNGDYKIDDNPNALIDKFRPFMSINSLSFDVRPTKGLLYYKTATLELTLFDKARMSQIAPFIKPELLNQVSSEIILEYGWQNNLGDADYVINNPESEYMIGPFSEFINSLKVKEKYIIVNSSYSIAENGMVNISLSLAMKGAAELRGTAFKQNISFLSLQTDLKKFIAKIKEQAEQTNIFNQTNKLTQQSNGFDSLQNVINELSINSISNETLNQIERTFGENKSIIKDQTLLSELNKSIKDAREVYSNYKNAYIQYFNGNFDFFNTHNINKNDAFIDSDWWDLYLSNWRADEKKWISLGKLLLCIIGKRLSIEESRYNEVQFIFYNLNNKAIRASFLNIGSIPVNLEKFREKLEKFIRNTSKISYELMIDFILNIAVNQKAADLYGLTDYLEFNESNQSVFKDSATTIDQNATAEAKQIKENEKKLKLDAQSKGIQTEIFKQYYGMEPPSDANGEKITDENLKDLNNITGGLYDLSFNLPKIVINFDSTFHENDPTSSILKLNFYDKMDNPFESVSEYMDNFHRNDSQDAISVISLFRSKKNKIESKVRTVNTTTEDQNKVKTVDQQKQQQQDAVNEKEVSATNQSADVTKKIETKINKYINDDIISVINQLIADDLVIIKDKTGATLTIQDIQTNGLKNIDKIQINTNKGLNKLENFSNMKNVFKTYMPSLTLGHSRSALISGSITTNQDPKFSTVQLFRQEGEINQNDLVPYEFQLINEFNKEPMRVIPAQASASIIGCPIVNFSQLIFLDFNTGTSIDNMYLVTGIKHSITPGSFKTDLTLTQADIYNKFTVESNVIKDFFKSVYNYNGIQLKSPSNTKISKKEDNITPPLPHPQDNINPRYQIILKVNHNNK